MPELWVALAHVKGTFEEDRAERGAYVHAVSTAVDESDLRRQVELAARELGYVLLQLEDAEPLAHRAEQSHASYSLLELGVRASRGAVEFGDFHIYESDDEEEDDEPPADDEDVTALLVAAEAEGRIVNVRRRPVPDEPLHGFVSKVGEAWVVLHLIDARIRLDGYTAIRLADVGLCRYDDQDSFAARALALRGERPVDPGVDVERLEDLLVSAQRQFGLVTIFVERLAPDVCYIGRVLNVSSTELTLEPIDPDAQWNGPEVYELRHITRVGFGGSYEQALALVAATAG